jgi:hypothetical protein
MTAYSGPGGGGPGTVSKTFPEYLLDMKKSAMREGTSLPG